MKETKKWGGKREGAGRPASSTKVLKSIKLEKALLERIEELEGTFTNKVEQGLKLLLEKNNKGE